MHELTDAQHLAIAALLEGKSMTSAAEAAGVARSTLYEWKKSGPFERALYEARTELHEATKEKRADTITLAWDVIHTVLSTANPSTDLAIQTIKLSGLPGPTPPPRPLTGLDRLLENSAW